MVPTIIKPRNEEEFKNIHRMIGWKIPKDLERVLYYTSKPHIIAVSIDLREELGVESRRIGDYIVAPVHSSDLSGIPQKLGYLMRKLANGEETLERLVSPELKTEITFGDSTPTYFERALSAISCFPETYSQIEKNNSIKTSLTMQEVLSTGINLCGLSFRVLV